MMVYVDYDDDHDVYVDYDGDDDVYVDDDDDDDVYVDYDYDDDDDDVYVDHSNLTSKLSHQSCDWHLVGLSWMNRVALPKAKLPDMDDVISNGWL